MNPRTLVARGICVLLASAPLSAFGGEFFHKTFSAKAYSGSRERQYQVFVPSAYSGQAVPLVMVLHGCKQTEQNMINETRFKELAERENFIVVYPFITSYDGTLTWASSRHWPVRRSNACLCIGEATNGTSPLLPTMPRARTEAFANGS